MHRSHRISDYFLAAAEDAGASIFPEGLFMYDLPSRRITSRTLNETVQLVKNEPISPASSIEDEPNKVNLTTSEDWWRQAIEPLPTRTLSISQSAFSMIDDDISNETHQLFSLLPSIHSHQRIIVHNQTMINLKDIYSDQILDYVQQMYERHSIPNLSVLIKRNFLKIYKEKSIRMTMSNKKIVYAQLDKNGKILSNIDNRLFDTIEQFYHNYQIRRKRDENLQSIYKNVHYYDQSFHSILLEYAETILKISGLKTRLISDEELISNQLAIENLSTELLAQINCWHQGRNEINLSAQST